MKISAFLMFISLWIIHVRADYRYRRMPPVPPAPLSPRAPSPVPPYLKKWHNSHLRQRPRPIPVHLGPQFKKPVGPPPPPPKRSVPSRPPQTVKFPQAAQVNWIRPGIPTPAPQIPHEKPFVSSPKVKAEYDFHIQTNQITNHPNLIPNLIPNHSNLIPSHSNLIPNHSNLIKQTDEKGPIHTIPAPNLSLADKPAHIDFQKHNDYHQKPHHNFDRPKTIVEIQKAHQYQVTESHDFKKPEPELDVKYFQNYPALETYTFPLIQPQILGQPSYAHKDIKPEYHTFNYEEPVHKSTSLSAEYSIQPELESIARNQDQQFAHSFYEAQVENVASNNVDPYNPEGEREELIAGNFYSSLPNKQAADTLASLQEAGKQMHENQEHKGIPMTIYVPDDSENQEKIEKENYQNVQQQQDEQDYDDGYSHEEESEPQEEVFGSRLAPKKY